MFIMSIFKLFKQCLSFLPPHFMQCSMLGYEKYNQDFHFLSNHEKEESLISPSLPLLETL